MESALEDAMREGSAALLRGDSADDIDTAIDASGVAALGRRLWESAFARIAKNVVLHSIFRICRPLPEGPQALPTFISRNCELIDELFQADSLRDAARP